MALTYLGASAWTFRVDMSPKHSTTRGSKNNVSIGSQKSVRLDPSGHLESTTTINLNVPCRVKVDKRVVA